MNCASKQDAQQGAADDDTFVYVPNRTCIFLICWWSSFIYVRCYVLLLLLYQSEQVQHMWNIMMETLFYTKLPISQRWILVNATAAQLTIPDPCDPIRHPPRRDWLTSTWTRHRWAPFHLLTARREEKRRGNGSNCVEVIHVLNLLSRICHTNSYPTLFLMYLEETLGDVFYPCGHNAGWGSNHSLYRYNNFLFMAVCRLGYAEIW